MGEPPAQREVFQALRLLTQVADALDYMHSGRATGGKPVVHRDIKPANIIVSGEAAVLVDFGLVRALTKKALPPGIGTVSYMAPEIVSDGKYTPASDRYALGCVSYYMLTGADPPGEYDLHVMRANLAKVPALGANASLLNHFMTMLDPDPAARPPRASAWVQVFRGSTLTEAGRKQGLPPIEPMAASVQPPTTPPGRPPRRRSSLVATLAIIAALLGGTATYAAVRQSRSPTEVESGAPGQQVPSSAGSSTTQGTAPIPVTTTPRGPVELRNAVLVDGGLHCGAYEPWERGPVVVDGRSFDRGYQVGGSCGSSPVVPHISFVLSKGYRNFSVVVGILDNSPYRGPIPVEVILDDAEDPVAKAEVRVGKPLDVNLNTTDVVGVTIRVHLTGTYPSAYTVGVGAATGTPVG
ncbi:MAG: protein kinase [Actinobacteria bacterium]|nr:protein kinase [Actinomycetota bacterium]